MESEQPTNVAAAIARIDADLRPAFQKLVGMRGPLRGDDLATRRRAAKRAAPSRGLLEKQAVLEVRHADRVSGSAVELLVLRPHDAAERRRCIYFLHSGGMVLGNNRFGIDQALDWARAYSAVVVSPEYRLAPEHPDPAPREDCYAGLLWTATHADELGVDADRIVVAGSSAGGGLAAALALLSRDRDGPCLAGQLLVCPMLDDRSFDIDWPAELNGVGTWDVRTSEFAWTALLGDAVGTPEVSAYAAPARAHHLADLPPAYVDVGSAELFAAPAVTYAHRLVTAEVATELHVWPGAFHGFDRVVPDMPLSQAARAARTQWLRNLAARS